MLVWYRSQKITSSFFFFQWKWNSKVPTKIVTRIVIAISVKYSALIPSESWTETTESSALHVILNMLFSYMLCYIYVLCLKVATSCWLCWVYGWTAKTWVMFQKWTGEACWRYQIWYKYSLKCWLNIWYTEITAVAFLMWHTLFFTSWFKTIKLISVNDWCDMNKSLKVTWSGPLQRTHVSLSPLWLHSGVTEWCFFYLINNLWLSTEKTLARKEHTTNIHSVSCYNNNFE